MSKLGRVTFQQPGLSVSPLEMMYPFAPPSKNRSLLYIRYICFPRTRLQTLFCHPLRGSKSVQPCRQPIPSLRNLQLNVRHRIRIIRSSNLLTTLWCCQHILTIEDIGILRPCQGTGIGCVDVGAADPGAALAFIRARSDPGCECPYTGADHTGAGASGSGFYHLDISTLVQIGG